MSGYTDEILDQQSPVGPGAEFMANEFTPGALVRQVDRLLLAHRQSRSGAIRRRRAPTDDYAFGRWLLRADAMVQRSSFFVSSNVHSCDVARGDCLPIRGT